MPREIENCRISIVVIELSIVLIIIGLTLGSMGVYFTIRCFKECDHNDIECNKDCNHLNFDLLLSSSILLTVGLFFIIVASINAAYFNCFKTAISGTIMSFLIKK